MKILFTQFTPPFTQIQSTYLHRFCDPEKSYLKYDDWYSALRRNCAKDHEVKFISFTRKNKVYSINHDGYEAIFFPVANPKEKVRNGRWDFYAPALLKWVEEYNSDVIHVVGTGHLMGAKIIECGLGERICLWERGRLNEKKITWPELKLSRFLVLPTRAAIEEASAYFPLERLVSLPMGVNVEKFRPIPAISKEYDIISVGHMGRNKNINVVKSIAQKGNKTWLHAGGINEGWPFSRWEDLLFLRPVRNRLHLPRVKKARQFKHICGFFENDSMVRLYNSAKVFVHPSLGEGAPRAVNEALSCEVPVVVLKSTVPYVEPEFGVVCNSLDEFYDATLELLDDDDRRIKMGRNGREWLIANHSPAKLYQAVDALNQEIKNHNNFNQR